MRVFISGATGVLGRRVVKSLAAGGHQVVGLSRSQANAHWLSHHGAEPRPGDLFNQQQMCELVGDCNAVLHLATAIPIKSRTTLADWAANDRIRRQGTQNLVEAALRNQCQLYVQQSVTFIYGDRDGDWVDENADIATQQGGILQSAIDMELIVEAAARQRHLPATILRMSQFYSHDSAHSQMMFDMVRRGWYPVIGRGACWNMINVDDAANAVVKAVENPTGAVSRILNVCDDMPVNSGDLLDYVAQILRARRPMRLPVFLANLIIGAETVRFLSASVRCRNQLVKESLGWQPQYSNYRDGFRAEIEKWLQS